MYFTFWKCRKLLLQQNCFFVILAFVLPSMYIMSQNTSTCKPCVNYTKNVVKEKNMAQKSKELSNTFSFDDYFTNVNDTKTKRKQWSVNLQSFIANEHKLYSTNHQSKEQEYDYGHQRFNLLGPSLLSCKHDIQSYGSGDDEKRACILPHIKNMQCVVLSFGSNNQWGFEIDIFNKFPQCRIETFDCTLSKDINPPYIIQSRTKLHHICIGDKDVVGENGWVFKTWTSILQHLNLKTSPDFVKMDIEGYEYPVLTNMIQTNYLLPVEIALELHFIVMPYSFDKHKSSAEILAFSESLYRDGNYFLVDRKDNPNCGHCTEILLARLE